METVLVTGASSGIGKATARGVYHATKHALEGWSDCLRHEVAPTSH